MSEIRVNNLSNESLSGGPTISGITTFSSPYFFVPPQGDTASRPQSCPPGSLRFNTDSAKLEYYKGNTIGWVEIEASNNETGGSGSGSNTGLGHRAIYAGGGIFPAYGGADAGYKNTMSYLTISTLGNSEDFGDLTYKAQNTHAAASRTRCLFSGGYTGARVNTINFVNFQTTGNAADFGDMTINREGHASGGNQERAIFALGFQNPAYTNQIDYVTIATTGNAIDFGDVTRTLTGGGNGFSGKVEFIMKFGDQNTLDYVNIMTKGNPIDWGDLHQDQSHESSSVANGVRGIIAGGNTSQNISYITLATKGNSQDFGDVSGTQRRAMAGMSDSTRAVFANGAEAPSVQDGNSKNTIDYIQIMTLGNTVDFGDSNIASTNMDGHSNGHGGLG